jgi:hypothetical protein
MGRYVPSHFKNPLSLAWRLIRSRDTDAFGAMVQAAAGILLAPLDLLMAGSESRLYASAQPPQLPQLFVCGPPRSGTTVVTQVLISHLPVAYLSNIMGLFPRSPITSERLIGRRLAPWRPGYHSYYGRVAALRGPNDALGLWDRWLGADRTRPRDALTAQEGEQLWRFFGALEAWTRRPLVAKNNNLNLQAKAVATVLPTARFLCLDRDPLYLAQSLLTARHTIHGDQHTAYGLAPEPAGEGTPFESVCRQVRFLREGAEAQRDAVGADRFWIVGYEDFCANPAQWITRVGLELLGLSRPDIRLPSSDFRLSARTKATLPAADFEQLARTLRQARLIS